MVYGENEEACGNAGPLVVSRENCEDFLELCGKLPGFGEKVFTFPKQKVENVWDVQTFRHSGGCYVQKRKDWMF